MRQLFKDGEAIKVDLFKIPSIAISRLHAVIGIVGELQELYQALDADDEENVKEEMGDLLFYITALEQCTQSNSIQAVALTEDNGQRAQLAAMELLDLCKKECIYAKQLSPAQIDNFYVAMSTVKAAFLKLCEVLEYTIQELVEHNIAKLSRRYPAARYTNEAAAARLDKVGTQEEERQL